VALLDPAEVVHVPKRPGEPDCTLADIGKIRRVLGWQPRVRFEDGVRTMLANIEYWREAPVWTPDTIEVATREWFEHLGNKKS
jgi:UDP-glucose 4-epimerase